MSFFRTRNDIRHDSFLYRKQSGPSKAQDFQRNVREMYEENMNELPFPFLRTSQCLKNKTFSLLYSSPKNLFFPNEYSLKLTLFQDVHRHQCVHRP